MRVYSTTYYKKTNGLQNNILKIIVSKAILAMSDKDDMDMEKLLEDSDLKLSEFPIFDFFAGKANKINNETDIGFLVNMDINYNDKTTMNKVKEMDYNFIPKYTNEKISLNIDLLNGDYEDMNNKDAALGLMFLATGKYRLLISKSCIPNIRNIYVYNDSNKTEISAIDLHDEYLIEIPMSILFTGKTTIDIFR